jgi:type IV secretion system protein VirD4
VLIDDAAELGYLPIFETMTAHKREDGFHLVAMFHSPNQVWRTYGPDTSLFDTCRTWVIYGQSNPHSAEFFSKKLGQTTVTEQVRRVSGSRLRRRRVMMSEESYQRPLLTAGEIGSLGPDEVIICSHHLKVQAQRINAYDDPLFRAYLQ